MTFRCPHAFGHSDEAKRMSESVSMHYQAIGWDAVGKYVAIRLSDGGSDNSLYDSKADAVRHQSNEFLCTYIKIVPMAMGICEAEIMLDFTRKAYDNGFRLADPDRRDGGKSLIIRGRPVEYISSQLKQLRRT